MDIKKLYDGLAKAKNNGTETYKAIAKSIYKIIQDANKIGKVNDIIQNANASYASMTKFLKFIEIDNAKILIALINEAIVLEKTENESIGDKLLIDISKEIEKARKILFIGVSSNYYINIKFSAKLERLDKWVVITPHKYEQIGLARLQTEKDLTIITSPSLQHIWVKDLIKTTKGKKFLLTGTDFDEADFLFRAKKHERIDSMRYYTINTGIQFDQFFGDIFKELIKSKPNKLLLKLTRYIS